MPLLEVIQSRQINASVRFDETTADPGRPVCGLYSRHRRRCREQGPQLRLREGPRLPGLPQELRRTARHTHASRAQKRCSCRHEAQAHIQGHSRGGVDRVSQGRKAMILPQNQWREGNGASHRLYLDTPPLIGWRSQPLGSDCYARIVFSEIDEFRDSERYQLVSRSGDTSRSSR